MKAYQVTSHAGFDGIKLIDIPTPEPKAGEVLVRVRATSLNYRDTIIPNGGYPRNQTLPVIALSDMAGEVAAVGEGVTAFQPGDRVAANFLRDWITGPISEAALHTGLGGSIDGVLAEYVALPAQSWVRIPAHLSFEEAATLPCAALTAWNALTASGIKAGDRVLLLGTGGVSVFGLQFAKMFGAEAIVTSSSDDKLAQARDLGADHTVNYRANSEWHEAVRQITGGEGVDIVVEVGGPGTFERSIQSTRVGGTIALIGLLDMPEQQPSILPVLLNAQTVRGIYVGSVEKHAAMNRAIGVNGLKPVIDRVFGFDETRAAYDYFASQKHVGKVVIRVA
ncbi:MAG: NAD(P)-dependent alcohol dehydrogenase [Sumerlaeia bacterium]